MYYSPSTSPPTIGSALLGSAVGIGVLAWGLKAVILRKVRGRLGRHGPLQDYRGKEAVYFGLFIVVISLFFLVPGILYLLEQFRLH